MLAGKVDDDLLAEIGEMIKWRNFLAHSYITMRMMRGDALAPDPRHLRELLALGEAFRATTQRVQAALDEIVASMGPADGKAETDDDRAFAAALSDMSRSLIFAQPEEFKP